MAIESAATYEVAEERGPKTSYALNAHSALSILPLRFQIAPPTAADSLRVFFFFFWSKIFQQRGPKCLTWLHLQLEREDESAIGCSQVFLDAESGDQTPIGLSDISLTERSSISRVSLMGCHATVPRLGSLFDMLHGSQRLA